jgi:uncharacterized protein (AIM24 family)
MVYIKGNIEVKTTTRSGGFFKKFKVAALGRQSFFVNNYVAHEDNCFIGLTGPPIGDIVSQLMLVMMVALLCSLELISHLAQE